MPKPRAIPRKRKALQMAIIPAGAIEGLIFEVRGVKVMLDIDLGLFFGSDTRSDVGSSVFGALRSGLSVRDIDPPGDSTPRPFEPPVRH